MHLRAPTASSAVSSGDNSGDVSAGAQHVIDVFDVFVKGLIPGSKRVTAFDGGADNVTSTFAAHTEEEAAAVAAAAAEAAAAAAAAETASSLTWELPASAAERLPEILESLEAARGGYDGSDSGCGEPLDGGGVDDDDDDDDDDEGGGDTGQMRIPAESLEGYAVGQASLEDVFLDFAQRGSEQSDAQLMRLDDALFAYRKGLSSSP